MIYRSQPETWQLNYRYDISLRIRHPTADLSQASDEFGLEPRNQWILGEKRKTPKGTPLPGFNKDSFWVADLLEGVSPPLDLAEAIAKVLDQLSPSANYLQQVAITGGRSELFIGWFFDEGNSGDILGWALLQRLAEMKIDLSFDIYGEVES